jgi:hypothetical protein
LLWLIIKKIVFLRAAKIPLLIPVSAVPERMLVPVMPEMALKLKLLAIRILKFLVIQTKEPKLGNPGILD